MSEGGPWRARRAAAWGVLGALMGVVTLVQLGLDYDRQAVVFGIYVAAGSSIFTRWVERWS